MQLSACKNCGNEFDADKARCPTCKKLRDLSPAKVFLGILVVVGTIGLFLRDLSYGLSASAAIAVWIWWVIQGAKEQKLREEEYQIKEQNVINIINQHIPTLAVKRKQLMIADEYGVVDNMPWAKEIHRFYTTVVKPQAGEISNIASLIERKVITYLSIASSVEFSEAMNPYDYERYCAGLLSEIGWNARATKASGDQGSDVIAEKKGLKIVLQCKLYTQPVGNKAVQEIFAAKSHEQASHAAVVTNQTFTRSARQIATTTGIDLLHHDQLQKWAEALIR